jgi:hypothetical protein
MSKPRIIFVGLFILSFSASLTYGSKVKTFVPSKPWQVTIDVNDFEPWGLQLSYKSILGGRTKDGITITIIVEKTKPGTSPAKIREIYGHPTSLKFGKEETIEKIDFENLAVVAFQWAKPDLGKLNKKDLQFVEDVIKDKWSFRGYLVKEDVAFDIHLSADMDKHTNNQMIDIIKSFQITPSTEIQELIDLHKAFYKKFERDRDKNTQIKERLELISNFIKKYPGNPDALGFMADYYLNTDRTEKATLTYLKALKNHKSQPSRFPTSLWQCYDGLGLCYGMSKEYDQSKKYFELGYELAEEMKDSHYIASSAYNLACLFAELNDADNSIKYLIKSIKLNPDSKEEAKKDPSFTKIKDNQRFKNIVLD